ncbi:MAG TPA: GDSL-type esterase/lipase family protein [Negativicutes bacterium]
MKRVIILILFLSAILYIFESNTYIGFSNFKPQLEITHLSNEYILTWPRLPYPAYYEIEVLNQLPSNDHQVLESSQRIATYRTWDNQFVIDQNFPFSTYWRVSAQGLFRRPVGAYSDAINLAQVMGITSEDFTHVKATPTVQYPYTKPASDKPMLTWTVVPGAVYYEIEFLSTPPENPNDIMPSYYQLFSSREVFTNGYNPDLSAYPGNHLYWRIRALDYDGNPLGVFSDVSEIFLDHTLKQPQKPLLNTVFNKDSAPPPLYPVFSWIPIAGAISYEVEVTNNLPENANGITPSQYRIWSKEVIGGSDCYAEDPFNISGTYFWRVRGRDIDGKPIGVYSDSGQFVVDLAKGSYAATFGDSITHGGGAISYSPADWEYSFQTYLNFSAVNLGKSGDTSETMSDRFDRDVLPYHPKFLIILGGTNSLRGGTPASQVVKDLSNIRDKCLFSGIRPIFLTLPPINPSAIARAFNEETVPNWREEFETVNSFIRQQRFYIDLEPYFVDSNGELPDHYALDGLHLDIEGKKLMAQIINSHWEKVTH